jgi:hypothetical protein
MASGLTLALIWPEPWLFWVSIPTFQRPPQALRKGGHRTGSVSLKVALIIRYATTAEKTGEKFLVKELHRWQRTRAWVYFVGLEQGRGLYSLTWFSFLIQVLFYSHIVGGGGCVFCPLLNQISNHKE